MSQAAHYADHVLQVNIKEIWSLHYITLKALSWIFNNENAKQLVAHYILLGNYFSLKENGETLISDKLHKTPLQEWFIF